MQAALKNAFLLICFIFISIAARAQSADDVYNQYLDFNLVRLQGDQAKTLELGEKIIPNAGKLPEKARISFYFSAGKMYEDNNEHNKALPYYERVAAAVPNYYVVHRALGYIYLENVKAIEADLNASQTDKSANEKYYAAYVIAVKKTLAQLEKAQACDPSDETLAIIKMLYRNIKDTDGLNTLDARLKQLAGDCMDILSDK